MRLNIHKHAYNLRHEGDRGWRLRITFELCNITFCDTVDSVLGRFQSWNSLCELLLAISLDLVCLISDLLRFSLFFTDILLDQICCFSFFGNNNQFLFGFFTFLDQDWLEIDQLFLHDVDARFSLDQAIVAIAISIFQVLDFSSLFSEKRFESVDELQVGRRCHIVNTTKLLLESCRCSLCRRVELLHHLHTALSHRFFHVDLA